MAEYVTKEQVIDWFRPYGHMDDPIPFETMVSDLRDMPAADVVPVVRCKDCKWGKTWKNAFGIEWFKCDLLCVDLSPEAFCSYGEYGKKVLSDG